MSDPKTVLIVEDEKNIVDILRFNLQRAGYQTLEAYDGEDGLAQAVSANPDLILLDVMLPKKNGFDVCRALRDQGSSVPVIILTAREEEADKVLGLEIGADDYITKPFSMRELVARVGANIRRTAMTPYSSLAGGRLSMRPGETSKRLEEDSYAKFKYDATAAQDSVVINRVAELADRRGVSMTEVSLAWLLTRVTAPVVGATKMHHIEGAAKAVDLKLTAEECAYLEEPYVPHALVGVMAQNTPAAAKEQHVWSTGNQKIQK